MTPADLLARAAALRAAAQACQDLPSAHRLVVIARSEADALEDQARAISAGVTKAVLQASLS
jgi:hypothetical protein